VYDEDTFKDLMAIDTENSLREFEDQTNLFNEIGDHLPEEMEKQRQMMLDLLAPKKKSSAA